MLMKSLPALAFAATLALASAAAAQMGPPPPPPPGAMGGPGHGWDGMREHHAMRAEARLHALHDALNIRPDQEGAFQAFAASMKPESQMGPDHDGMDIDRDGAASMPLPERLDAMAHKMDEHVARMREGFARHAAAVKALYAVLSPEQRHTLDALPVLIGHPGMGGGMGPGMGRDHDGMEPGHPGDDD